MKKATLTGLLALLAAVLMVQLGIAQVGGGTPVDDLDEVVEGGLSKAEIAERTEPPPAPAAERRKKGGSGPLVTGFTAPFTTPASYYDDARSVNAEVIRIFAPWPALAPQRPAQPTNPASYNWGVLDQAVNRARSRGMRVILDVNRAPRWAEGPGRPPGVANGTWKPNPNDLGNFGEAIARHYSGAGPTVKDFMLWNEPNLETNLTPQWAGGKSFAAMHYRKMLNAFYEGVKKVKGTKVITGGTAPYGSDPGVQNARPLLFWREVLCVRGRGRDLQGTNCPTKAKFDVLSTQPINTSGGPTRSALHPDDISTPDVRNLVAVLRKSEKAKNTGTKGKHPVWATENWWETNPPDPGDPPDELTYPLATQARFYAETLYSMWKQGASMVLFLEVRDDRYDGTPGRRGENLQSGVFFNNGQAKPSARAFSFPFVADPKGKRKAILWGKAPGRGKVKVEVQKGSRFKPVATFKKLKPGEVFTKKVKLKGKKTLRARMGKQTSLNWQLR